MIAGQIGTLNEFTIAFQQKKPIGVLEDSGGITALIKKISVVCDKKGEGKNIIYSSEPIELVSTLLKMAERIKQRKF